MLRFPCAVQVVRRHRAAHSSTQRAGASGISADAQNFPRRGARSGGTGSGNAIAEDDAALRETGGERVPLAWKRRQQQQVHDLLLVPPLLRVARRAQQPWAARSPAGSCTSPALGFREKAQQRGEAEGGVYVRVQWRSVLIGLVLCRVKMFAVLMMTKLDDVNTINTWAEPHNANGVTPNTVIDSNDEPPCNNQQRMTIRAY